MKRLGTISVALLLTLSATSGCAQSGQAGAALEDRADESISAQPSAPELFVADTGVENTAVVAPMADWPVNVNDPLVLRDFSSAVVSGKVTGVERSWVDGNGFVVTTYTVQVEKVYKGDNIGDVISVTLPGGTVPLGEYISTLDKIGRYQMMLGAKSAKILSDSGVDPSLQQDPREMDPATPVSENSGLNPASESLIKERQPDSWVFYIGSVEGGVNYGAAADHALSYLKDGLVYSLHPEASPTSIPETELFGR